MFVNFYFKTRRLFCSLIELVRKMTRKMFMFCGLLILFTDSFGRKYLIKTEGISFVSFVYFHWYHIKDETENMDVDTDIEGMELKINNKYHRPHVNKFTIFRLSHSRCLTSDISIICVIIIHKIKVSWKVATLFVFMFWKIKVRKFEL